MLFAGSSRRFIGVDFDSRRLRIVQTESAGKRVRVRKLRSFDIPADVLVDDAAGIGACLAEALKQMGMSGTGIVMHVPRSKAVLKPMTLPGGEAGNELAGMVRYQMEREMPIDAANTVIDFAIEHHFDAQQPTDAASTSGVTVLVAAVRSEAVDHCRKIAEAAGVKLLRVGLRPYANMRCVQACGAAPDGEGVAVIHVTADETEIDVVIDGSVAFSRAATAKVLADLDDESSMRAITDVVAEVARSLKSYQAVQRGHLIDRLLIAGDTGIEKSVADRLADQLGVPCTTFDPVEALAIPKREDAAHSAAYISALGLSISHAEDASLPFDFLNPKRPGKAADPAKRKLVAGISAAAAVLLFGAVAGGYHVFSLKAQAARLQTQFNDLEKENKTGKTTLKRVAAVDRWVDESRDWLDHWAQLSSLLPSAPDVYVTSLKASAEGGITLQLHARSDQAITDLGKRLTEAGYDFKPGSVATTRDRYGYVYATTVRVIIDPKMSVALAELKPTDRPGDDAAAELIATYGNAPTSSRSRPTSSRTPPPSSSSQRDRGQTSRPQFNRPGTDQNNTDDRSRDSRSSRWARFRQQQQEQR